MKVKKPQFTFWTLSVLLSVIAILIIGLKWYQVKRTTRIEETVIKNQAELEDYLSSLDTIEQHTGKKPIRIPTGFFIQSLSFNSPSDVNITGYAWQKFPENSPIPLNEMKKGFIFAEEVNSADTKLDLLYELDGMENGKKYKVIGWRFEVTVRQSFDYSHYPLDFLTVWIRLWVRDFKNDANFLFVPDFKAYANTERKVFGLDGDIVPGEWEIDETFFGYSKMSYDTDFGFFTPNVKDTKYKEFQFELGLRRKFFNSFVIHLVPLFVVALLLFGQMTITTLKPGLIERFGFNTSGAIATCSALFFVVMLAHIQLRSEFAQSGLLYIEYFYLIMYFTILMTAVNSYIVSLDSHPGILKFFSYEDNLLPRAFFWPILLWSMAIVTLFKL